MASAGQRSRLGTLGILWLNYSGVMLPCSGRHQGISATLVFSCSMASIELRSKLEPQKRIPGRSLGEPMNSMPAASKEPLAADFRIETFSRAFTRLVAAIRNNINLALKDDLRLGARRRNGVAKASAMPERKILNIKSSPPLAETVGPPQRRTPGYGYPCP